MAVLRAWSAAGLLLALCACASSEPARFYGLSAVGSPGTSLPATAAGVDGGTVVLQTLRFPEYLNRPQIVTRSGANTFEFAEFDRWAEPLNVAFQRSLAVTLAGLLPRHTVVSQPLVRTEADYRIGGEVLRFDTDAAGLAVLEVQWTLERGGSGTTVVQRSRLTDRTEPPHDYASVAAALNRALEAFAGEIRDRILAAGDG